MLEAIEHPGLNDAARLQTDLRPLRLAWIGGAREGGGVGGFALDLLRPLSHRGDVDLTLFTHGDPEQQREALHHPPDLTIEQEPIRWTWDRWYSRSQQAIFLTSLAARASAHRRLIRRLEAAHAATPFDVVLQFSQTELLSMRRRLDRLPPIVVFPCVHAAGELRWHRQESSFARQVEPAWRHYVTRAVLIHRARQQRRDLRLVSGQVGMSRRFNELMRDDYGIPAHRQAVVHQPVTERHLRRRVDRESNSPAERDGESRPVRMVFVGRLAVRKGLDMLIDLSHRLDDLAGRVRLDVIGGISFFSNYRPHVKQLNERVASHLGHFEHEQILRRFAAADFIVVPSKYEPGGIVLPEAMAQGCAAVVSDEVGAAEPVAEAAGEALESFPAGDAAALEQACRRMVERVEQQGPKLRAKARQAAAAGCSQEVSVDALVEALRRFATAGHQSKWWKSS